jgi:hypothetical protein
MRQQNDRAAVAQAAKRAVVAADVPDDNIVVLGARQSHRQVGARAAIDVIAVRFECALITASELGIVVDDENRRSRSTRRTREPGDFRKWRGVALL